MPFVPAHFVPQAEIDAEVANVVSQLGPEVIRVRHQVREDTTGDPAIYFRIVLADSALWPREPLRRSTRQVEDFLTGKLQPLSNWGLIPYFSFRSESEQATRHEPEWS
jgi:hypothetical protein